MFRLIPETNNDLKLYQVEHACFITLLFFASSVQDKNVGQNEVQTGGRYNQPYALPPFQHRITKQIII
jgi:hypothetical protein